MNPPRYEPCPEYKDSDVERLGDIPAHWEGVRIHPEISLRKKIVDAKWRKP